MVQVVDVKCYAPAADRANSWSSDQSGYNELYSAIDAHKHLADGESSSSDSDALPTLANSAGQLFGRTHLQSYLPAHHFPIHSITLAVIFALYDLANIGHGVAMTLQGRYHHQHWVVSISLSASLPSLIKFLLAVFSASYLCCRAA